MNLADNTERSLPQASKLARRASIIPEDRNSDAPPLQRIADMASARWGDVGGADALMRSLGLVQRAGDAVVATAQARHAQAEEANIAKGTVDHETGHVDPAMERKSLGYRNAVTKGRTMSEFNAATRDFDIELRGLIETDDDVDLEVRRQKALDKMEEFYANFTIDPETQQLRPFLQSPDAMRYLAQGIAATRPQFENATVRRIEQRFNTEARGHFGQNILDQIVDTQSLDLELARSVLPATVTGDEMRATFVESMKGAAFAAWRDKRSIDGLRFIDAVLGRQRPAAPAPMGTPGTAATDQATPGSAASFLSPDDPVEADASFRLPRPMEDPVDAYERTLDIPTIVGLEKLQLSAEDRLDLQETRAALEASIRREWNEKVDEEQSFNASSMALRLYGQGSPLTSVQIRQAMAEGQIGPDAGLALYGLLRRNAAESRQFADRQQAQADRASQAAEEATINSVVGRYITRLSRKQITPPQARDQVIREVSRYHPRLAQAILNGVLGIAGDVESSVLNGEATRTTLRRIEDSRDYWIGEATRGRAQSQAARMASTVDVILHQATAEITLRTRDGEDPAKAEAAIFAKYKPRLDALRLRPRQP